MASPEIDPSCPVCNEANTESITHRFWDCTQAQQAWTYVEKVISHIRDPAIPPPIPPNCNQVVFGSRRNLGDNALVCLWTLLQGITLWTLWISRNDTVFNHSSWPEQKIFVSIWNSIVEYGKAAWLKTIQLCRRSPRI